MSTPETSSLHALDLRQVEIFYHVAKLRSFSKAAAELRLAQPTISGHIKGLESTLALVLFNRIGREISLTRAGEILYTYARRVLSTKTAALQALHALQGGMRGELVLGCSSIPGQYVMPVVLGVFLQSYTDITVTLSITDTMETLERIARGDLELGVVGAYMPHLPVLYDPFIDDELVLVVRHDHPWLQQESVPVEALLTQPFLQRERGSGSRLVVEQSLREQQLDVARLNVVAEMDTTEAIKQGVKAGMGVAIVSRLALTDELRAGSLRVVPLAGLGIRRSFYVVRHKNRVMSPLCQTFVHFFRGLDLASMFAQPLAANSHE